MRTILAILVSFSGILESFGQGTVDFANDNSSAVTNLVSGGRVVTGTRFRAALYYAPDGTSDDQFMVPIGASSGFMPSPGLYVAGTRTTPALTAPGGFALFQVRVWETAYGTSYEAAARNFTPLEGHLAILGKSNCVRVKSGDPANAIVPGSLTASGLLPFNVVQMYDVPGIAACPVPEPSPWLTVGAGAAMLFASRLLRSRRRK